jgi:hypothetical protein
MLVAVGGGAAKEGKNIFNFVLRVLTNMQIDLKENVLFTE